MQMSKRALEMACGEVKSSQHPAEHQRGDSSQPTAVHSLAKKTVSHSHFAFHQAKPSPAERHQDITDFEGEKA